MEITHNYVALNIIIITCMYTHQSTHVHVRKGEDITCARFSSSDMLLQLVFCRNEKLFTADFSSI